MRIRKHKEEDTPAIAPLYFDTVHQVNSQHYSKEQIEAWAPHPNPTMWRKRFLQRNVLVADVDGDVAGFSALTGGNQDVGSALAQGAGPAVGIRRDRRRHRVSE